MLDATVFFVPEALDSVILAFAFDRFKEFGERVEALTLTDKVRLFFHQCPLRKGAGMKPGHKYFDIRVKRSKMKGDPPCAVHVHG